MKIQLHIERLVLEGLPVDRQQGSGVQAAVERELSRLLGSAQATLPFGSDVRLAAVNGGTIQVALQADAAGLGNQIATAVYAGLGGWR